MDCARRSVRHHDEYDCFGEASRGGDGGWDAVCGGQDFDDVADEGVFAGMYEGMCDGDFLDYG